MNNHEFSAPDSLGKATGCTICGVTEEAHDRVILTHSFCPECGPNVRIDEDGCCVFCGATATGRAVDALPALTSRYHRCSRCKKSIDYETGQPATPMKGAEQLMMNMACKDCVDKGGWLDEKPKCSRDSTHGVVMVRERGTFKHFWTCLSCHTQIARAPDRDPDIPEKFEY